MTDTLMDLALKCEAATGADRELDAEIAAATGIVDGVPNSLLPPVTFEGDEVGKVNIYGCDGRRVAARHARHFTASLDAALSLVPEGCWPEGSLASPAYIEVHNKTVYEPLGIGRGATPALALCAAALKARAQVQP